MIHLVQIGDGSSRRVAIVEEPHPHCLIGVQSVYELAQRCLSLGLQLSEHASAAASGEALDYDAIYSGTSKWHLLAPIDVPGASSRVTISGTGLKHLGSAKERQAIHLAGAYRALDADKQAWKSALRTKRCLLAGNRKLRKIVAGKLVLDWSPQQISGWLKTQYPNDESMRVSHETIYRSLFLQARGVLKKELMEHLRSKRRMRRSLHATVSGQSRGQIVDAVSIRERPAEAEDRAVSVHWEGDLLSGAKNSYIATLVERHSRFAMLVKVPGKDTEASFKP